MHGKASTSATEVYHFMRKTWQSHKCDILKHLKEGKKTATLLRAIAFEAMVNFKAAFIASETQLDEQRKMAETIMTFTGFLDSVTESERGTKPWERAHSIVIECLISFYGHLSSEFTNGEEQDCKL